MASPPVGGPEQIDERLGFKTSLVLAEPTTEIPFPVFRLRARVKQLFSSVIASIDTDSIQITTKNDFRSGEPAVIRDDGAGEADPDILTALAIASNAPKEDVGLCRSVTQSAQIRCAGLKGMLLGSPRLQGTRRVEVPENMLKFGAWPFEGEHLHVLNFSRIRPTTLGRDIVLRLEACGCDVSVFVDEQQRYLKKIGNCKISMEDAVDCLRFAQQAAGENDDHSSTDRWHAVHRDLPEDVAIRFQPTAASPSRDNPASEREGFRKSESTSPRARLLVCSWSSGASRRRCFPGTEGQRSFPHGPI